MACSLLPIQLIEGARPMKAVVIRQYGGPDVLKYEEVPDPVPGKGEVLIRVAAASINPVDLWQRAGAAPVFRTLKFPDIIGWDLSGTVVGLGPEVHEFAVGDHVFAWAFHTYAELCAVKTGILARIPDGLDLIETAALPLVTITGSQLISIATSVEAGQTVLVSGAVGAVGRAAVRTARDKGAFVIAGVRKGQLDAARSINANQLVALDDQAAVDALAPVDIVANTVRGGTAEQLVSKVRDGGVFASVTGVPESARRRPSVRTVAFVSKQDPEALLYMAKAVRDGELKIPISQQLPLRDARQAHIAVEQGAGGKILLLP
jgi:NADPH:quinone reductase-like Zn-dependent oxidoreductase